MNYYGGFTGHHFESEHISGVSFVSVQREIKDANDKYGFIF